MAGDINTDVNLEKSKLFNGWSLFNSWRVVLNIFKFNTFNNDSSEKQNKPLNKAQLYPVGNSVNFYTKIADEYDNKKNLLHKAHDGITRIIDSEIQNKTSISVLDLGAGTGRAVATHFKLNSDIFW